MRENVESKPRIPVVFLEKKTSILDYEFLRAYSNTSAFWTYEIVDELNSFWRKRSSYNLSLAKKHNRLYPPIMDDGSFKKKDILEIHKDLLRFIRELRNDMGIPRLITVTRKHIPGSWFVISDYSSVTLISTKDWDKVFAPPPVEIYLIKTIVSYVLLYLRDEALVKNPNASPFHKETRGCLYDDCENKSDIKASLWGNICEPCQTKLRNWGVSQDIQDEAVAIIRRSAIEIQEKSSRKKTRIFISYAKEDLVSAEKLYETLRSLGFDPWIDKENLLPGQDWKSEIEQAIHKSDIFIACLSSRSVNKRGYVQAEYRKALEAAEEIPEGDIFIIPLRLDECTVPHSLKKYQWLDYFDENEQGKLIEAIQQQIKSTRNRI